MIRMTESTVRSKFLEVEGNTTHYLAAGQGPKVVTLHGLAGPAGLRARARERSVSMLASHGLEVVSLDLPGFGLSQLPNSINGIRDYPTWLIRFSDAIGANSAVSLVGNSMGGGICLLFALQFPARMSRLVIVGSTGIQLGHATINADPHQRPEETVRRMFYDPRTAESYLAQGVLHNSLDETSQFMTTLEKVRPHVPLDLTAELPSLLVPTLILWGQNDQIIPVSYAHEFARLIPNASLRIIQNCGHLPQIEKPEESHVIIAQFLKG